MAFVHERIDEGHKWDIHDGILALSNQLFDEKARKALDDAPSKDELQRLIAVEASRSAEGLAALADLGRQAMGVIDGAGVSCDSFKGRSRSFAYIFSKVANGELPQPTQTHRNCAESADGWCSKGADVEPLVPQLRTLLAQIIEALDCETRRVNTLALMRENYRSFALLADLYRTTQQICSEQNTMLLTQTANILEEFIRENDAPFIYEKVGNRFSRFMIDEFQDTSRREWNNFLPLLQNAMSQSRDDENSVLIVGDIKQSIYRWRGGDWRILRGDAVRELGERESVVINMDDNYRSLPRVVEFNNQIIERAVESIDTSLNEALASAVEGDLIDGGLYKELHGTLKQAYEGHAQHARKRCEAEGFVEVVSYEEQPPIIDRICGAIDRGFKPCDILILTRTNTEATTVAEILLNFKNQNRDPRYRFDIMTQEALIVGNAPVSRFIVAVMQLAIAPNDRLQRAKYNRFLDRAHVDEQLTDEELAFLANLRMHSPIEAFEMICMEYRLSQERSYIAYLQAIHEQIIRYSSNKIGDIALFVEWWHEKGASQSLKVEMSDSTIEILTIHKAKGLEKSVVIIPYSKWSCEPQSNGRMRNIVWSQNQASDFSARGAFPITYKNDMGNSHFAADYYREKIYSHVDSINMLYVALTRAVESLHIFVPFKRSKKGAEIFKGVGKVIMESLPEGGCAATEQTSTHGGEIQEITTYKYGELAAPIAKSEEVRSALHIAQRYDSSPSDLRLRMPSLRYHEEALSTPREVGIMMHKAFEQATTSEDIFASINQMLTNGSIDQSEHAELVATVERALEDDRVREWFDGDWQSVRNESQIIQPHGGGTKSSSHRPDRVMVGDDRVVVVDYKFGALHASSHRRQMAQYIALLRDMGYAQVEGFIWYIREGEIVEV